MQRGEIGGISTELGVEAGGSGGREGAWEGPQMPSSVAGTSCQGPRETRREAREPEGPWTKAKARRAWIQKTLGLI